MLYTKSLPLMLRANLCKSLVVVLLLCTVSTVYSVPSSPPTVTIRRTETKGQSVFGKMSYEGKVLCYTLEHETVKIPAGTYQGELRYSERFHRIVPYIRVPSRTGIEVHVGNCPGESGGCVLVGTSIDGACLGSSKQALQHVVQALPSEFTVVVE